jgi:hypothetical protein
MTMPDRTKRARVPSLALAALLLPALATAGPPLVCFPMAIGDAASLPWGAGSWNSPRPDYDARSLADDTLALLGPRVPVLVRMETLRRAAIYAERDGAAAGRLFASLRARALDEASSQADPLALFDLGYAAEVYRQAGGESSPFGPRAVAAPVPPEDGYALVRRALERRGEDPAMEYAAALMTCHARRVASDKHLELALAGAPEGSLLARTIAAHRPLWGARLDTLRASTGR